MVSQPAYDPAVSRPEEKPTDPQTAIIRLKGEDIFAIHDDLAFCHMIIGMTGHHLGERAFAGTVRAHDGVHLTTRHGETQTAHDLLIADGDVEVFDTELVHKQRFQI